jgi:hypothetical protein
MNPADVLPYFQNCFILIIPVLLWNVLFARSLPRGYAMDVFWKDIPAPVAISENILRISVFVLPLLMPLSLQSDTQKLGLMIYIVGILVYFASWLLQISLPGSAWSRSPYGFLAPGYTTIIWLAGTGLIGRELFFDVPYHPVIYFSLSMGFVLIHTLHASIVFRRL